MSSGSEHVIFSNSLRDQTAISYSASQRPERYSPDYAGEADVWILESLEHAEERNAEILAEIVVYEASGEAILVIPAEGGGEAHKTTTSQVTDAELAPDTPPLGATDAARLLPLSYAGEQHYSILRVAATVVAVLILALLAIGR